MYVNERDQINYHGFLRALREMNQVSQECVSKGICTVSGMNRFENGNRLAEKLMRDRLTARLGISGEKYEDYLQPKEFVRWEQRLRIVKAIEKKNCILAKSELMEYEELPGLNCVNKQFIEAMRFMILSMEGASNEALLESVEKAIKYTVPNLKKAMIGAHLLSDQEINLMAEKIHLCPPQKYVIDKRGWRIGEYKKLISYIDNSFWEKLQKAKVYPKIVWYVCQLLMDEPTEMECRYGLELCHTAIELLRDSSRLYYFMELTEARRILAEKLMSFDVEINEKCELEKMLNENNAWEKVLKDLYTEYGVNPYMSDFCYLYYETECHNMVEVIETRRKMLGLSRVKLGDGICTDRTIIRFEREGRNPSVDLVRLLFEKMGLCAEYRRARVITNDVEALMLSIEVTRNMNSDDFINWENNLLKLENMLHMGISYNKQEVSRLNSMLKYRKKDIGSETFGNLVKDTLEYTLPISALETKGAKYLTRSEITSLFDLVTKTKGELSERCLEIIYDKYGTEENDTHISEMCVYEFVTGGLVNYLGSMERHDDSCRISNQVMKECLSCRRIGQTMNILYNIIWNYQNSRENKELDYNYIKDNLYKCLTISEIAKKNYRITFFQNKLLEFQ